MIALPAKKKQPLPGQLGLNGLLPRPEHDPLPGQRLLTLFPDELPPPTPRRRRRKKTGPKQLRIDWEHPERVLGSRVIGITRRDPTPAEIGSRSLAERAAWSGDDSDKRKVTCPVAMFAVNVLAANVLDLKSWSRNCHRKAARPQIYFDTLNRAILAREWMFEGGDQGQLMSFLECCEAIGECPDGVRRRTLRECDPGALVWLVAFQAIEQAGLLSPDSGSDEPRPASDEAPGTQLPILSRPGTASRSAPARTAAVRT